MTAASLSAQLGIGSGTLILTVLPHALLELTAVFLPLAAWLIASRRDEWEELLAATFVDGGHGAADAARRGARRADHLAAAARGRLPVRLIALAHCLRWPTSANPVRRRGVAERATRRGPLRGPHPRQPAPRAVRRARRRRSRRSRPGGTSSRSARSGSGCRTTRGSTSRSSPTSRCGCCASPTGPGSQPAMVTDHGMGERDAEVVVAGRVDAARHRHVHPPDRPRGLQPVPRRAEAALAARRHLRGAGADRRRLRGAALHHRPPPPRSPLHARGRGRPGRRRARHGPGPFAAPGRARRHRHPLDLRRRDRRRPHRARDRSTDPGRDQDEQLGRASSRSTICSRRRSAARRSRATSR